MVAKAETVKPRSISSASRIDDTASLSILGFSPLSVSSTSELLPYESLVPFKTHTHVRFSCYAVVCIIKNISVGVFLISGLNLMIALTFALFDDVITRLILLSAVLRKYC